MSDIEKIPTSIEGLYSDIKSILEKARKHTYHAINFAMVESYWMIGQSIYNMSNKVKVAPSTEKVYLRNFQLVCQWNLAKVLTNGNCAKCVNSILLSRFGTHCVPN